MRILHISTRLILGGSQENTVLSCEGQARLGHDVHLAFGPIYGPEGSMLERVERFRTADGRGITTHVVPDLCREISPGRDRRCIEQIRSLIRAIKPDVVHTHSSKAGIVGRLAGWRVRREDAGFASMGVVHTIHGPPFMPVEGGMLRRATIAGKNRVYALAERRAARACHVIVSVADAMTREYLRRGIGRVEQYVTVYSGMETERFLEPTTPEESRGAVRARLGLAESDVVVGTVARLAEHKGHDDLLDALAGELKRNPSWKLLWVGDGWWRGRLLERAGALGLGVAEIDGGSMPPPAKRGGGEEGIKAGGIEASSGAQVIVTGLVPPERVPAMLRAMDVLAHPSYREGLPRTVPQALLCGVCPVAYDVDGTGEACMEMQTGRLVPAGDRERLREAIVWCANNPGERGALARRGREMCRERFSAEHMVRELEKVYARAIERAKR
ncbi:MAG: glycosyltransferase [Phycisphaerales bacterium]